MPKGVKSKLPAVLKRVANIVVPPNAKYYPDTECEDYPEGVPLPDGVRVRTGRGVEVRFLYQGERMSETVRGRPTVEFVVEVGLKRDRIMQVIGLGKFTEADYREEFPDSNRFAVPSEPKVTVYTVWAALEDWYTSRLNTVGVNTDKDYIRAIRNQLVPLKLNAEAKVGADEYVKPGQGFKPPKEWSLSRYEGGPSKPIDPTDHQIFGNLPLARVDDVLLNQIRQQFLNAGIGVKRINNLMAPIRGAIERAFGRKLISSNPLELLKPLRKAAKGEKKVNVIPAEALLNASLPDDDGGVSGFYAAEGKPDPFSPEEMKAIIAQFDGAMANQITFAFWTGLRTGETIALRLNDINFETGRILVRRSVSRGVLKATKTDKARWVTLLPPARAALEAQVKLLGDSEGWVFPNPFTKRRWANDSKITKRWTKALESAGVRYRRPYQTRHTFASMMLSGGEHTMYVAQQMGHADWSMLVKVYGRWMPSVSATPAGHSVSKVQSQHWADLMELLKTRSTESPLSDDYDGEDEESEPEGQQV